MRAVEVSGPITGRDLWDGMRARRGMRVVRWGIAVAMGAGVCGLLLAPSLPDREGAGAVGLLGGGVRVGAVVGWSTDRLRLRRLHAAVTARGECRMRLHEGGIEAGGDLSTFTTGWKDHPHRAETERCLVLLGSRGMSAPVMVIPKRLFASPEEIEEARGLVARHTTPLTGAGRG
ncbi:hypothetical protein GCM10027160_44210 [Streptomyces calidiresistens]|uniref:YcxB-like protein domain-containing protein n=1 Tax=Streptomyces calidiresistens TaxID=1485586 RepID=A0A7W3XX43_9ACTN|nr:hypothetical protein [Streptomyces calidiresistens]MBB0230544.1 hypothetical protein [Streptomyces calidiresistens]